MDGFTVLADPTRRSIVDRLRVESSDVSALTEGLGISQSLLSKHLRVLRDAGIVQAEIAGRRRVYRLSEQPFPDVVAWAAPYVELWRNSLGLLAEAMNADDLTPDPEGAS